MKQHAWIIILALLMAFMRPLSALDRIALDSGEVFECEIVSQTRESITYRRDGVTAAVDKTQVKKIELDIEVDKYLNAALTSDDMQQKENYLRRSIETFPGRSRSRAELAVLLLVSGKRDEAKSLIAGRSGADIDVVRALVELTDGRPRRALRTLGSVDARALDDIMRSRAAVIRAIALALTGDTAAAQTNLALARTASSEAAAALLRDLSGGKTPGDLRRELENAERDGRNTVAAASFTAFLAAPAAVPAEVFAAALKRDLENARPFSLSLEALGGSLVTVLFDWQFIAPFAIGAAAGFDYAVNNTNGSNYHQFLFNASVYGAYRIIASEHDMFTLDARLHAGVSIYTIPQIGYTLPALELTPSVQAGMYNAYLVLSGIIMLPLDGGGIEFIPQLGIGYRLRF